MHRDKEGERRDWKPTIRDVAKNAQTSVATVSRVINKVGYVSPELKNRVHAAIMELGYRPNAIAKSLKDDRTKMIGLLISDIANPFFSSIVRGVEDVLNQRGYTVVICSTDEDSKKEKHHLSELIARQVDGLIVSAASGEGQHFNVAEEAGIPLVFVNRGPIMDGIDVVMTDNVMGGFMATAHLISLNHKRIGAIVGPQDIMTGRDRFRGYLKALETHHVPFDPALVKYGDFGHDAGYRLLEELVHESEAPSGVFVANNLMTLGALERLQELNVKVPDDLSIVGFDYSDWMRVVKPRLTAVIQPSYELGRAAARRALQRQVSLQRRGVDVKPQVRLLEPVFMLGASTMGFEQRMGA